MALLEVDHVSKRFGGLRAVSDVTFSIHENTITFIVGPNGAGKTTLFNLITGVVHPDEGRIRFGGADITRISPNRAARIGIGRTFQIVKPLGGLTVLEDGKGDTRHGQGTAARDAQTPGNRARACHQAKTHPA
jgi:branched-chain amino acid transport system ATP-binding protein